MFTDRNRLRDHIVFLEVIEGHHIDMDATHYLAAARSVREIVERELGALDMAHFQFPHLPTLQVTAENIYFDTYRCLPDVEGSGDAAAAQWLADHLLDRLRVSA